MNLPSIKIVIGLSNRFAAGNYNEHLPSGDDPESRMEAQNALAISDENAFLSRFGFDAPLEQRRDVIALQRFWDFTNREISKLKASGCMILSKGKATSLCASSGVYAMGHVFLLCSALPVALAYMHLLMASHSKSFQSAGQALIFICAILFMFWFSSRASFEPVGILRKRGLKLGQCWILPKTTSLEEMLHPYKQQ